MPGAAAATLPPSLPCHPAPAQLIVQVSQHGLRPGVPEGCSPALAALMQRCWHEDPSQRPSAAAVVEDVKSQLLALRQPLMQSKPSI